ncbi:MAG: hypothetical protein ACM3US_07375 [Sphingomonadaceae bacterium]
MKRVVLWSTRDTVTVRRQPSPAPVLPCLDCRYLAPEEVRMGFRRSTCALGHLHCPAGAPRRYSDHELAYPSRELLALVAGCPDHAPQEVTA